MPDPTTPAKGLTQPTVGADNNAWGGLLNTDLSLIDTALGGTLALSISGNTTLTSTQAENTGYEFNGTLSAAATITWPSFYGMAVIRNGTSGGFPITCGISGATVVIMDGETVAVWSDGTSFYGLAQPGGGVDPNIVVDVYAVGGQSNAEGIGVSSESITVPPKVVLQSILGAISAANDPVGVGITGGAASTGSAWPSFGATYYALTGRKICFALAAYGGTYQNATAAELAGQGTLHWDTGGTLAPRLITYFNDAITGLLALGYVPRVMGILWCQGENDAGGIENGWETQSNYQTSLTNMIAYYRSQTIGGTTYPELPFYIFQTGGPQSGDNTYYQQIRAAQEAVVENDEWARAVFSNAVDFIARGLVSPTAGGSNLHYTQPGYNEMGRIGAINVVAGQAMDFWQRAGANSYGVGTRDIYYPRGKVTIGAVPGADADGVSSPDSTNIYLESGNYPLGAFNPMSAGADNFIIRIANTADTDTYDQRVGIIGQPGYGVLGATYGGAIIFQQDESLGTTNIEFGGYEAGDWTEFGRWGYNGGMLIGSGGGVNANGGSFGAGTLGLFHAASTGNDNNLLNLINNYPADSSDQRVGILLNPGGNEGLTTYGAAIIASWDGSTGRSNLEIGGYSAGTWNEHARFTYDGGFAVGTTTDPGSTNLLVEGTGKLVGGLVGVTNASSATAGTVGEVISSNVAVGSGISMPTGTAKNITSISLTAGDWDVWATVGATVVSSTSFTLMYAAISEVSTTFPFPGPNGGAYLQVPFYGVPADDIVHPVGMMQINVSATTTVYLVLQVDYGSGGTPIGYGYIGARRRR